MVKHIVLFKFKKTGDIASVKATMREFKSALEALKDKIPFLRFIEVGVNENPKEDFDMCLVTEFDSMEDLANREYCQGIFAFFSFCNDVGGIGMIPFERGTDCSYRFL